MKRRDLFKHTLLAAGAGLAGSSELFAQTPKPATAYAGQLDMLKGQEGIGRALFCTVVGKRVVILHGFIKKTEQTPQRALDTARRRMKEVRP